VVPPEFITFKAFYFHPIAFGEFYLLPKGFTFNRVIVESNETKASGVPLRLNR
jgi:hypothetical protein